MQMQQRKFLLSEEDTRPRSVVRVIVYTIVAILSAVLLYAAVSIFAFIFLIWFTINGDIKPVLKIAYGVTKPLHGMLFEIKLKEYPPKEKD